MRVRSAARTLCALKAEFDALSICKGRKKSVAALAHMMLRTVCSPMPQHQAKEVDYEALNVQPMRRAGSKCCASTASSLRPPPSETHLPLLPSRSRPASGQAFARLVAGVHHIKPSKSQGAVAAA